MYNIPDDAARMSWAPWCDDEQDNRCPCCGELRIYSVSLRRRVCECDADRFGGDE